MNKDDLIKKAEQEKKEEKPNELPVIPPLPRTVELSEIKEAAEQKLEKGVTNKVFNMKLKQCVDYIDKVQELITKNEELQKNLQQREHSLQQREQQFNARETQLKDYTKRVNFNVENIAAMSARDLVRKRTFLGLPRRASKIYEDYEEIKNQIKNDLGL